jgi:hypothetical protein
LGTPSPVKGLRSRYYLTVTLEVEVTRSVIFSEVSATPLRVHFSKTTSATGSTV